MIAITLFKFLPLLAAVFGLAFFLIYYVFGSGRASEAAQGDQTARPSGRWRRSGVLVLLIAGPVGLYLVAGQPFYPDQPYQARIEQLETPLQLDGPQYAALQNEITTLQATQATLDLTRREAYRAALELALNLATLYEFLAQLETAAAYHAARLPVLLAATPADLAPDETRLWAELYTHYGRVLVQRDAGVITPLARQQFEAARRHDPGSLVVLYALAEAALQDGHPARARQAWEQILGLLRDTQGTSYAPEERQFWENQTRQRLAELEEEEGSEKK